MTTAIDATPERAPAYTDMTLEELVDAHAEVVAYIDRVSPELQKAAKARTDIDTMIALRLEESGARRFERAGWRGFYKKVKRGAASVFEPGRLRAALLGRDDIPEHVVEAALPIVKIEPVVKPDLRAVRKCAEYGDAVAAIVRNHIVEAQEYEMLVIEPLPPVNVTGTADDIRNELAEAAWQDQQAEREFAGDVTKTDAF